MSSDDVQPISARWRSRVVWVALAAASAALGFAACATPDPKEHFGGPVVGPSTGGATAQSGGQSGTGGAVQSFGGGGAGEPSKEVIDFGCGPAPAKEGAFSKRALRAAAAACAEWNYCNFEGAASALEKRSLSYADDPSAETLALARKAHGVAMDMWSIVELFQFGPLSSSAEADGRDKYEGLNIRDRIYAWPDVSRCKVDEQVVTGKYATFGMDSLSVPNSSRGLWGLEYLLFYEGNDTGCSNAGLTAQTYTAWQALSAQDIGKKKRAYAKAIASDVDTQAERLVGLWKPEGGNFRATFTDSGSPAKYPDEQEAMNVLAWSLVYVEVEVKDWKLGSRAGITPPEKRKDAESPYALRATEQLRANLRGFRALFQGCGEDGAGIGFDDWLRAVGQDALADDMIAAYENAQATLDALPAWPNATPAQIQAAYDAVKALTDLLKADFFGSGSALNLEPPAGIEGDTD